MGKTFFENSQCLLSMLMYMRTALEGAEEAGVAAKAEGAVATVLAAEAGWWK